MAAHQDKCIISIPGPPPADLSSYTRFMHQHTMRQIEQIDKPTQSPQPVRTLQIPTAQATSIVNGMGRQSGRV